MTEPTEHAIKAEQETAAQALLKRGYVEVSEINALKVGARVKHRGEQWPEASRTGTATIERIFHKPESSWSQSYSRQDIELIVKRDAPAFGSDYGYWADYHVELAYEQEVQ